MSRFQDQIAADLKTFLPITGRGDEAAEFDQVRQIDGAPVACILDDDERVPGAAEGVYLSQSVLHLRTVDLAAIPVITQRMVIDERQATVVHVDEAMGMLSIRLQWFES